MNVGNHVNHRRRQLTAALPLLATALYLRPALASADVHQAARTLMGTRVDITVQTASGGAQAAIAAAFEEMARLSDMMSRYRPASVVSALNLAAGVQPVRVPAEMMNVLKMAAGMSQRSAGAFDITVGAYAEWNFDPARPHIPSPETLVRERPLVDFRDLILDERAGTAYLRRRGMRIDLGGIAKLPILEAGMQTLKRRGITTAMINGGGDVLVSGQLKGRDWRIGLRDPRAPERLLGVVHLSEGFVAASGDYERCFIQEGRRYHHILDPRTGRPSAGPHGVTLVGRDLSALNGLGAAIMVAGADKGRRLLAGVEGVDALIVERNQQLWRSVGMSERLRA